MGMCGCGAPYSVPGLTNWDDPQHGVYLPRNRFSLQSITFAVPVFTVLGQTVRHRFRNVSHRVQEL